MRRKRRRNGRRVKRRQKMRGVVGREREKMKREEVAELCNGEGGREECQHLPLHSSVCMRNSALPWEVCEGGHPAEAT